MSENTKETKCAVCGGSDPANIAALIPMGGKHACDRCVMKAAEKVQGAIRMLDELPDLRIDLEHYPVENHLEYYGLKQQADKGSSTGVRTTENNEKAEPPRDPDRPYEIRINLSANYGRDLTALSEHEKMSVVDVARSCLMDGINMNTEQIKQDPHDELRKTMPQGLVKGDEYPKYEDLTE